MALASAYFDNAEIHRAGVSQGPSGLTHSIDMALASAPGTLAASPVVGTPRGGTACSERLAGRDIPITTP
jgi:hypothetical protein